MPEPSDRSPAEREARRKAKAANHPAVQMRLTPAELADLEAIRQAYRLPNRTEAARAAIRFMIEERPWETGRKIPEE